MAARDGIDGSSLGIIAPTEARPAQAPPEGPLKISRRAFIAGALTAAAVVSTASLSLSGCGSSSKAPTVLAPDSSDVYTVADTFAESTQADHVTDIAEYTLPAGTLLWLDAATYAATLIPGSTAKPLSTAGITSIESGEYTELLPTAAGASDGFDIFDVRCSSNTFVWTELNYRKLTWRVYAASLSGTSLGTAKLLEEGDSEYDTAPIAAGDNRAIWVVQPSENGSHTYDSTYVKSQSLSSSGPTTICTSKGRLATSPHMTSNVLTITPRVDTSGIYYRMLACDPASGTEVSSAVLPKSVKPLDVLWTGSGFSFAIEASYDSAGAIGGYGVYLQQGNRFLRLSKIPLDGVAMVGSNLICKTSASATVLATSTKQYCKIDVPSGAASYGDCIATGGMGSVLVLYTTVATLSDSSDASVRMRVIKLA